MPAPFDPAELERRLHGRMRDLIAPAADHSSGICENSVLLVRWMIDGTHADVSAFNQSACAAELLAKLRTDYGFRETPVWSISLASPPPKLPASWSEQQTLLGEFLRRVRELESPSTEGPDLDCFLSERQSTGAISERLNLGDPVSRTNVLQQAAILGAELLSTGSPTRNTAAHGDSSRGEETIRR